MMEKVEQYQYNSCLAPENSVQVLNGQWELACDPENVGKEKKWFLLNHINGAEETDVPGIIQMTYPDYHGVAWYTHTFTPQISFSEDNNYFLKFSFVDYYAQVWFNGVYAGDHEGGEMSFEIDVTDLLESNAENLLVVRIINPTETPIDDIVLDETPHRCKSTKGIGYGGSYNYGGIVRPVELVSVPKVRIEDVFVNSDVNSGNVHINMKITNYFSTTVEGRLRVNLNTKDTGQSVAVIEEKMSLTPGKIMCERDIIVLNPHLWDLDDPYLYEVTATIEAEYYNQPLWNIRKARFGFRDFRVEKGYFRLNGKRVFVRSTHTLNHYPQGQIVPVNKSFLLKDLICAKASGFNMVRFIAGSAFPEQLNLCDEMGLMVYEECYAAWKLADSPRMAERFDESTLGMIRRDRNHPCITVWGLLNETEDGAVFGHAVSLIEKIRDIDDTRLVVLSSGRWDRKLDIGTISNPHSTKWEFEWGEELQDNKTVLDNEWHGGLYEGMGDIHFYPGEPKVKKDIEFFKNTGADSKPIFLSETGVGSQFDLIQTVRHYEQDGARPDLPDFYAYSEMEKRFTDDWNRYGMDGVYPFPGDMLRDSQILQTRQRERVFSMIRSNPKFCGYNLTGMLDHVFCGEGLWTFFRDWKPGIVDVLQDGWAPLRWCLFIDSTHVYAGRPFTAEAVLANEDVLKPGDYPVCFRISGSGGIVWEKETVLSIPEVPEGEDGPLAINVINEDIVIDAESGIYEFSAYLKHGGAPKGGRLQFYLSNPKAFPQINSEITLWGVEDKVCRWLESSGAVCQTLEEVKNGVCPLILIGDLSKTETTVEDWKKLLKMIASGGTAVFLCPSAFKRGEESTGWLPLKNKGTCYHFNDWLYHKECIAKDHPYFKGMNQKGVMDSDYFDQVIPHELFDMQESPDETIAAAFAVGYPMHEGYASGIIAAAYKIGAGRLVMNTLYILENLDLNPTADKLLLNIIVHEQQIKCNEIQKLLDNFEEYLNKIVYK